MLSRRIAREGAFEPSIREFVINDAGIVVVEPFERVETVLSGIGREVVQRSRPTRAKPQ